MGNKFGLTASMKIDVDYKVQSLEGFEGEDMEVVKAGFDLLNEAQSTLAELQSYHGNAESIRSALSNSQDIDLQRESFSTLRPNIDIIAKFHCLSVAIAAYIETISSHIVTVASIKDHLPFVQILGNFFLFAFEFDQIKMLKPEIQNDFSFYRRSLGSAATGNEALPIPSDDANVVSMWLAVALPMIGSMCTALANNAVILEHMTNIPFGMLARKVPLSEEDRLKMVNIMIVSAIMYDRVCGIPGGVFTSHSGIKIKKCIHIMKRDGGNNAQQLAQSIKYSTIHYNDDSTPKSIKRDLDRL